MSQMTLPPSPPLLLLGGGSPARMYTGFLPQVLSIFCLRVEVSGVEGAMTQLNSTVFLITQPSGLGTGGGPKM